MYGYEIKEKTRLFFPFMHIADDCILHNYTICGGHKLFAPLGRAIWGGFPL